MIAKIYITGFEHRNVGHILGVRFYDTDGKYHHLNSPSKMFASKDYEWHIHGKRHRIDGPAIVDSNGCERWFLHGIEYTEKEYWLSVAQLKGKSQ